MTRLASVEISGAVEGIVDEAVLRRLVQHVGAQAGPVHGKNGKTHLRQRLNGYNQAARFSPWVVLVDLDHDADCAPPFQVTWLPRESNFGVTSANYDFAERLARTAVPS